MRIGSLCSGYGGLDIAVEQSLDATPAWFCEFSDGPSKILAHHYPTIPNHRDLTETDWATVEPVDIITAGWPCQPWSLAGAQKGANDERAIWPAIATAIRHLRPRLVFLENVPAIIRAGELARAVGSLAAIGYDAQWACVRASDVGATHKRERCFIVASDARREHGQRGANKVQGGTWEPADQPQRPASPTAHPSRDGRHKGWPESAGLVGGPDAPEYCAPTADADRDAVREQPVAKRGSSGAAIPRWTGETHADPDDQGSQGAEPAAGRDLSTWGNYQPAIERWAHVIGRPAPAPTETGPRGGQRLSPVLVEWMMGLPEGWVTQVPDLSRNEQLKALGNGVVPQQAVAAFSYLLGVAA